VPGLPFLISSRHPADRPGRNIAREEDANGRARDMTSRVSAAFAVFAAAAAAVVAAATAAFASQCIARGKRGSLPLAPAGAIVKPRRGALVSRPRPGVVQAVRTPALLQQNQTVLARGCATPWAKSLRSGCSLKTGSSREIRFAC
jgi:hypothetical protein